MDDEELQNCGTARLHIVGVQYYTGVISNGEAVSIRREPTNKYDRNALSCHAAINPGFHHTTHDAFCASAMMP